MLMSDSIYAEKNPLIGSWKSNKEKTHEAIIASNKLTTKQKDIVVNHIEFGSLVLHIYKNHMVSQYDGAEHTHKYKLIAVNGNKVSIEEYSDLLDSKIVKELTIIDNILYIPSEANNDIIEVFARIK